MCYVYNVKTKIDNGICDSLRGIEARVSVYRSSRTADKRFLVNVSNVGVLDDLCYVFIYGSKIVFLIVEIGIYRFYAVIARGHFDRIIKHRGVNYIIRAGKKAYDGVGRHFAYFGVFRGNVGLCV
jgi:hypothetical protein